MNRAKSLPAESKGVKVVMFLRRPTPGQHSVERVFADIRAQMPADVDVVVRLMPFESRRVLNRLGNMLFAWRHRGAVNHVAGDVHYLALVLPKRSTLLTVLDLVSVRRTTGLRHLLLTLLWYRLPVLRSEAVTVISQWTRAELVNLLPRSATKVSVIPCPVSPIFQPSPLVHRRKPVLLQVGTGPNKNLMNVVDALAGIDVHLRVIGMLDGQQIQHLVASQTDFSSAVGLSDTAMAAEYGNSEIVLFVSTYEGFGLPIVEAQASARPVITSACASMPEVAGEAAIFVNPHDVQGIRSAVRALLSDRQLQASMVEAGLVNVARFRSAAVAQDYASLYRALHRPARRSKRRECS